MIKNVLFFCLVFKTYTGDFASADDEPMPPTLERIEEVLLSDPPPVMSITSSDCCFISIAACASKFSKSSTSAPPKVGRRGKW